MIIITQLVYIVEGKEQLFDKFESLAIPLIAKYNGQLLLRLRPDAKSILAATIDAPYEVHLVEFDSEADFRSFSEDEERKSFLYMKERSVKTTLMFKGQVET